MNHHRISTFILWSLACAAGGYAVGDRTSVFSPYAIDVTVIERRLREVYCEQAVHNGVMKRCDPTFPRYQQD